MIARTAVLFVCLFLISTQVAHCVFEPIDSPRHALRNYQNALNNANCLNGLLLHYVIDAATNSVPVATVMSRLSGTTTGITTKTVTACIAIVVKVLIHNHTQTLKHANIQSHTQTHTHAHTLHNNYIHNPPNLLVRFIYIILYAYTHTHTHTQYQALKNK